MAITTKKAARMQTNAAWLSPSVSYKAGSPLAFVDISSWTIDGVAVGAKGKRITLNAANSKIVRDSATAFRVSLTQADTLALGVGEVVIEIMRHDPTPVRPILRMTGFNYHGVA